MILCPPNQPSKTLQMHRFCNESGAPLPQPTFQNHTHALILQWFWWPAPPTFQNHANALLLKWFSRPDPQPTSKTIQMYRFGNDFSCPAPQSTFPNHTNALILQWFWCPAPNKNISEPYKCNDFAIRCHILCLQQPKPRTRPRTRPPDPAQDPRTTPLHNNLEEFFKVQHSNRLINS